jgi:hypothetical protein
MILPERVFGRPGAHWMMSTGDRADLGPTQLDQFLLQLVGRLDAGHGRDVGVDALALDVVRVADDRGLGDGLVQHQRGLDLGGAQPVAGDVEHVVDAPGDPVVAVLVARRRRR